MRRLIRNGAVFGHDGYQLLSEVSSNAERMNECINVMLISLCRRSPLQQAWHGPDASLISRVF
jgi:hypothetical protein